MKHKDDVQRCICGRDESNVKSFFSRFDVVSGWIVLAAVSILLLVKIPVALPVVILPTLIIIWAICVVVQHIKRHTLLCAMRWAVIAVIGSMGGSWMLAW